MDPIKILGDKIEEIKDEVERRVEIAILTQMTKFNLSRLATLDPMNAAYVSAIQILEQK